MKLNKTLSLGLIASLICMAQISYATSDVTTTYKNQRGSTMTLVFHQSEGNTGTIEGTFVTAVGNCKADVGVPVSLSGFYNGNAVGITVNFPHCKQVVSMTGNLTNNQNQLHTLWLDAAPVDNPRNKDWRSNIIGSDNYHKVN